MADKPSYEELQRRVKELEKSDQERFWLEEAYTAFTDQSLQGLHLLQGEQPRVVFANNVYAVMLGHTIAEIKALSPGQVQNLVHPDDQHFVWGYYKNRLKGISVPKRYDFRIVAKDGTVKWVEAFACLMRYRGRPTSQVALVDISERKQALQSLKEARDELEMRVRERTVELLTINQQLRKSEQELELKTAKLEEVNTALKVLLKTVEGEKKGIEEKILFKVRETVEPFIEKLKTKGLQKPQAFILDIIESNLKEITSPLSARLASGYYNLSRAEAQVANLVSSGRSTKEIADLLNVSPRTIETQRNSIRKKLGIANKKVDLRTHVLSLS